MLKLRILTAIILIPLVLWGIFALQQPAFVMVSGFVIILAAWEWAALLNWTNIFLRLLYVIIIILGMIGSLLLPPWVSFAVAAIWWFLAACWVIIAEMRGRIPKIPKTLIALIGLVVLVPCWQALIVLHLHIKWLLMLLIIVWLADTSAYFGGRWLGRTKLAPIISPKKTLEGAYIALVLSAIIVVGGQAFLLHGMKAEQATGWLGLVLVTTIASIIGDLFESMLKRQQGLKDSGRLLPGHGGVLDRIDSLTAAAPVFACTAILYRLV